MKKISSGNFFTKRVLTADRLYVNKKQSTSFILLEISLRVRVHIGVASQH